MDRHADGTNAVKADLQNLFSEVTDLDGLARSRYFDEYGVSPELRLEVKSLLRFDNGSSDVIDQVVGATVELFNGSVDNRFFEPYELVRLLGEGGMGSVYLAQRKDGEVDLRVAVKLIRGPYASRSFRERFLRERQILASLNHPGITRLLDAGHTKSGQPYPVMEYVDGIRSTFTVRTCRMKIRSNCSFWPAMRLPICIETPDYTSRSQALEYSDRGWWCSENSRF